MVIKDNLPKVLIIGINAWREDGTAHTLMDIFRCWNPDKLALVYSRADMPDTTVCNHYFQISETQVMRSVLRPWIRVGKEVQRQPVGTPADVEAEHERYARAHKKASPWMPLAREMVWKLGHWKTKALKTFVKNFDPDILFIPIYPVVYMGWIQKYIINLTGKPTVCYLADDNYSYDSCKGILQYIHRYWLRRQVGPIARKSNQMFVIVDKEKEDTDRCFGTDSVILTKSIDFIGKTYEHHTPDISLKFVYTGSLLIGRDKTLALLADAINQINSGGERVELYVYSQTEPSDDILRRINNGASHFCGRIGRDEVLKVQREADVVVFAEALEGKDANVAKLSFSTKITDYLSSGKCILAIGREYIAPIDYFNRYDAAIIAHSENEIHEAVIKLINNPELVDSYGEKAFNTAKRNHERDLLNKRFVTTMLKAIE